MIELQFSEAIDEDFPGLVIDRDKGLQEDTFYLVCCVGGLDNWEYVYQVCDREVTTRSGHYVYGFKTNDDDIVSIDGESLLPKQTRLFMTGVYRKNGRTTPSSIEFRSNFIISINGVPTIIHPSQIKILCFHKITGANTVQFSTRDVYLGHSPTQELTSSVVEIVKYINAYSICKSKTLRQDLPPDVIIVMNNVSQNINMKFAKHSLYPSSILYTTTMLRLSMTEARLSKAHTKMYLAFASSCLTTYRIPEPINFLMMGIRDLKSAYEILLDMLTYFGQSIFDFHRLLQWIDNAPHKL